MLRIKASVFLSLFLAIASCSILPAQDAAAKKTPEALLQDISKVEARFNGEFSSLYKQCQGKKIPLDYPTVAKTTLSQFIPYAKEDAKLGDERRAENAIRDFNRTLDQSIKEMKAYLAYPKSVPVAVRYQTSRMKLDGLSQITERKDAKGKKDKGPVFFCGYGHFSQIRTDMPKWPGYGVNIIQSSEFGPAQVLTGENEVNLKILKTILKAFDDAAKHNVKVNLLLSPHYFPDWAMKKWPKLGQGGGGFLGFTVDEPEAKYVVEKFLRIIVPMFKDHPALHSFCLSNEPYFDRGAGASNTRPMWVHYLTSKHGDVAAMNKTYGTSYKGFDEVPMPGKDQFDLPQYYDWCVFNMERFAGWHKWMADVIREIAPGVPVESKPTWAPIFYRPAAADGVDPEMFAEFSQLNGNDCCIVPGGAGWKIAWLEQNKYYDLQRSIKKMPIFNSENHLQADRSTEYVLPEHYQCALWQGAVHGQGATTIWVWERCPAPKHPDYAKIEPHGFYGNIMDRPGCAEAVGRTCLDLNRFAKEVTALQNAKSPVAVFYSVASWGKSAKYMDKMTWTHMALNFCGSKVDFITEKQLVQGKGKDYKMIVFPCAENVPALTFDAVRNLPRSTRIVMIGDSLAKDPYGNAFPAEQVEQIRKRSLIVPENLNQNGMWPIFFDELKKLNAIPAVTVIDTKTGNPVWGVEWVVAKAGNRTIINMANLLDHPVDVKVVAGGKTLQAKNLLSLGGKETIKTLQPMIPALAEVKL